MHVLPVSFYRRDDVVATSRELLGKVLCSRTDGVLTKAIIIETEAYDGPSDRASHAYANRRTKRTEPLFQDGGIAYVYLCYGLHHMFNVVTNVADKPHAVLVRAGEPLVGLEHMLARRGRDSYDKTLLGGPGSLGKAMGITTALTGIDLSGDTLWLEDHGFHVPKHAIEAGPRIGIDYAGEDARLPYRFVIERGWLSRQQDGGWLRGQQDRGRLRDLRLDPVG